MIAHITVRVKDIEKTKDFYEEALQPLGYVLAFDDVFDGVRVIGFGKDGKIDTWFTTNTPTSGPVHFCFQADSREEVDQFYAAALRAGGKDNGAPGLRPEYHANYYGAFALDPDGNNIEAAFGS